MDGLKTIYKKKGDFIINEGDEGTEFYILEQGEVECLKLTNVAGK